MACGFVPSLCLNPLLPVDCSSDSTEWKVGMVLLGDLGSQLWLKLCADPVIDPVTPLPSLHLP